MKKQVRKNLKINFELSEILLLAISFALFIYVFYKSEFFYDGIKRAYFYKYYFFSSVIILFAIIYKFFDKNLKKISNNILLLSVFSLYFLELIFTVHYLFNYHYISYDDSIKKYETQNNLQFDKRLINEVYLDEKRNNPNIALSIGSSIIKKDKKIKLYPLAGVSNAPTIGCNLNGYWSKYVSDRYGFNNPDFVWDKSHKKKINVMLFGNHEIHSNCIDRPNDLTSKLRSLNSTDINFINLGINSNGPVTNYAILKEYTRALKPQHILWFFDEDTEISFADSDLNSPKLVNYFTNKKFNQNLINKQTQVDQIIKMKIKQKLKNEDEKEKAVFKIDKDKFVKFLKLNLVRSYSIERFLNFKEEKFKKELTENYKKLLVKIYDFSFNNNIVPHLIILPSYERFFNNYENSYFSSNQVIEFAKNIGFNVLNLVESFEKYPDPKDLYAVKYYNGYSAKANEIISQGINQYLNNFHK